MRSPKLIIFQSHTGETVADIPHETHVVRDQNKSFVHSIMGLQERVISGIGILQTVVPGDACVQFHELVMTALAIISRYVAIISKTS